MAVSYEPPTLDFIQSLRPDFTPLPSLPEGSPGVRLFILEPLDDPLPKGGLEVITYQYWSVVNWVRQASGFRVLAHPQVILIPQGTPVATINEWDNGADIAFRCLSYMNRFTEWRAVTRISGPPEVWLLACRGVVKETPCALSANEEYRATVGWAILPDAVISAWLAGEGLEASRPNLSQGDTYYYSPHKASGIAAHELLHGLGASHHPTGIMHPYACTGDWPNVHIDHIADDSTMAMLAVSPLVVSRFGLSHGTDHDFPVRPGWV
jgi:hypothetical protein